MKWEKYDELVTALKEVRDALIEYANVLARASEVSSMILEDVCQASI